MSTIRFDAAAPGDGLLRLINEVPIVEKGGRAVLDPEKEIQFALDATALPEGNEFTVAITYYDEVSNFASFAYPTVNHWPRRLGIDRRGDGGFVTVTFPLNNANLSGTLPDSTATLSVSRMALCEVTITPGIADDLAAPAPVFAPQTEENNLIGKGVAGYQVWFRAGADRRDWFHWGGWREGRIKPAHELYPYMEDYKDVTLRSNGQANLGNGKPAELFTSTEERVIDTHFAWMQEYDLDGVGVQRFMSCSSPSRSTGRNTLQVIRDKAEKYGRLFYVMYDFSGCGRLNGETFLREVALDFIFNVEETGVATSPNYAHADGRPVVCFWGISGDPESRYVYGTTASKLIRWFQERGYYVIVGTPDNLYYTRTDELLAPFKEADMLSPWTVGRYRSRTVVEWLKTQLPIDLAFCQEHGVTYQPVLYAGFAWTNLGNRGGINDITHEAGQFLWTQAYMLAEAGVNNLYFAMFDEYDEATAIMKAASDYFEIPTDQYYLTYAADGWWLSNDFYLRAAGAAIDMAQGKTELRPVIDIPHSTGPVYWRNSFESREVTYRGYDNLRHTELGNLDVCLNNPVLLEGRPVQANISDAAAKTGRFSFRLKGCGPTLFKMAQTAIATDAPLKLTYAIKTDKAVYVCLLDEEGGRIGESVATDATGEWQTVSVSLGQVPTIAGVAVAYDGEETFEAFVDDILLEEDK